jgi:hypothetical protein
MQTTKVYIVQEHIFGDGDSVCAVFLSQHAAEMCLADLRKTIEEFDTSIDYSVSEWELR